MRTSSRPTRRSIRAIPAARWWTCEGQLIGINTAILGPSGGNVGIGFAIPANMVRDVMAQLVRFGEVRRGQLGASLQELTPDLVQALGLGDQRTGAVIAKVDPNSAGDRAGLRRGDVVVELGGRPVRGAADLRNRIGLVAVGDVAELTVIRAGQPLSVRVTMTVPARVVLEGRQLSALLDGATFASVPADTAGGGVEIVAIQPDSAVWASGLRKGDVITSVNQKEITGADDFVAKVKASPRGLLLNLVRDGNAFFVVLR